MIQIYLLHNTETFWVIKILTDNKNNLQTRMLTVLIHPRYTGEENGNHKNCFICILLALPILKKMPFFFPYRTAVPRYKLLCLFCILVKCFNFSKCISGEMGCVRQRLILLSIIPLHGNSKNHENVVNPGFHY